MDTPIAVGTEWLVEASGCEESALQDEVLLRSVFAAIIADLGLKTVGREIWHKFSDPGGVTGLVALTESHLACHTYPEHGAATFNLYCCKDRPVWNWEERLGELIGARFVSVQKITRTVDECNSGVAGPEAGQQVRSRLSATGGDV